MNDVSQVFEIGSFAALAIMAGSVIVFALAGEQLFASWRLSQDARDLGAELGKALMRDDLQAARTVCERSVSPVADIFIAALNKVSHPGESIHKAADRERQRMGMALKKRMWAIGTVGATAPFVGLFGTVVGIIKAFKDIAAAGAGGFSVVAEGVSEALVATAGGILVAVIAVVLYNWLQARGQRASVEVRLVVDEFLEQLEAMSERPEGRRPGPGSGIVSTPPSVSEDTSEAPLKAAPAEG